jgi:hypothetical protein
MNRWAVVVAVSDYPKLSQEFPPLASAGKDAAELAACLTSRYCRFPPENVVVLANREATLPALRQVFSRRLAAVQPQDVVFFFFVGHGCHDSAFHRFALLLQGADGRGGEDMLPLEQLAEMISTHVPARHIFLCLDARRSRQALGDYWLDWQKLLPGREVCTLEASAPQEMAQERSEYGLFAYFFCKILQGKAFLEKTADRDGDGFITVSELKDHVCWAMQFAGISQHPVATGDSSAILSCLFAELPHVQLVTSPVVRTEQASPLHFAGFVRSFKPVESMTLGDGPAQLTLLSAAAIAKYRLLPAPYTYWFVADVAVNPDTSQLMAHLSVGNDSHRQPLALAWSSPGWYGEWMPPGLNRAQEQGIYVWRRDNSEMVYVPAGECLLGMPDDMQQQIARGLKEMRDYLADKKVWLEQDAELRREISAGLEQSNSTIRQIAQRLKAIYKRVDAFDQMNRRLSRQENKQEKPLPEEEMPPSPLQENLFLALSYDLLYRCYRDLGAVEAQKRELAQTLLYLEALQMHGKMNQLSPVQRVVLPAFYMDRHEVSNRQYKEFCEGTARPYPASPWWDESYLFESPDYPVVQVSWEDAMAYTFWVGKKLPRAYEWEKSARGVNGALFPWGNLVPSQSLVNGDVPPPLTMSDQFTLPAHAPLAVNDSRFATSPYGCRHLAGNVQEWCADVPDTWAKFSLSTDSGYRLAHGGSFASPSLMLSGWFVHPFAATTRRCDLGFRCAVPEER